MTLSTNDLRRLNYCYENIDKLELADQDEYSEVLSEYIFSECFIEADELSEFFTILKHGTAMELMHLLTGHSTNSNFVENAVDELNDLLNSYEDDEPVYNDTDGLTIHNDEA